MNIDNTQNTLNVGYPNTIMCPNCGCVFPSEHYNGPNSPQPMPQKRSKKKITIIVILSIFIIVAATLFVVLFTSKKHTRYKDPIECADAFINAVFEKDQQTLSKTVHKNVYPSCKYFFEDGSGKDGKDAYKMNTPTGMEHIFIGEKYTISSGLSVGTDDEIELYRGLFDIFWNIKSDDFAMVRYTINRSDFKDQTLAVCCVKVNGAWWVDGIIIKED